MATLRGFLTWLLVLCAVSLEAGVEASQQGLRSIRSHAADHGSKGVMATVMDSLSDLRSLVSPHSSVQPVFADVASNITKDDSQPSKKGSVISVPLDSQLQLGVAEEPASH
mmetsp:Transcript_23930/g.38365  ORF Transcript_23930/g.38365 Transcript_23930/m.38365 type:complete len:111 (-) Transcript_23930:82-414(-)